MKISSIAVTSLCAQVREPLEECLEPCDDARLHVRIGISRCKAARLSGHEARDLGSGLLNLALRERLREKRSRGRVVQGFVLDDYRQLALALLGDVLLPVGRDVLALCEVVDETLDKVALVAQLIAGCDCTFHVGDNELVGAIRVVVLLHQHQDVVDVDVHLFEQLDLEDEVVVDDGGLFLVLAPFLVKVGVDAAVVLLVARGQRVILLEFVEGHEHVAQAQYRAEEANESLFGLFPEYQLSERELADELVEALAVLRQVLGIWLEQNDASGISVAEEADGVVDTVLEIAEADDVAVGLYRVQDAIGAAERLDEAVVLEVLVNPKRVERLGIEAGEEHVDHDDHVELTILHAFGQVLVVVLELLRRCVEARREHGVVVVDGGCEEVAVGRVEALHVEALVGKAAALVALVGAEAVNEGDLKGLAAALRLDALKGRVVHLGHAYRRAAEDGVEAHHALVLQQVVRAAPGLLGVAVEHVIHDEVDAFLGLVGALAVDVVDLLVGKVLAGLDGLDVVDAEGQHVAVADGIDDCVGVQVVAERLLRGAQLRVARRAGVVREDGRSCEAKEVVGLEMFGDCGVHLSELAAVAFVEHDHHMTLVHGMLFVLFDEHRELLDGGHEDAAVGVFELLGQDRRGLAAIHRALLEAVVLAHGLIVQVLAVYDEHDLVDACHGARELGRLEAGERLARAGGVPHVAAGAQRPQHALVVLADEDAVQDALGGHYLVGAHDKQVLLHVEDAVARDDVEDGVLGEER